MKCRFCGVDVTEQFVDLHSAPPSNSYLRREELVEPETYYPLKVFVCTHCWLVQIDEYKKSGDIFNADYAYFSSFSSSWLKHAADYSEMITERLNLNRNSQVVEIASNDGYLLKNFLLRDIPCYGVEPTGGTAEAARKIGVQTVELFFSEKSAGMLRDEKGEADLIIGNNVLAHVPDINCFVSGIAVLLKNSGTVTMEFPHLLNLIEKKQFDTIYHEHFSYLSLLTVKTVFEKHGFDIYHVEELFTHGGSLRIYAKFRSNSGIPLQESVEELVGREIESGITDLSYYKSFQKRTELIKNDFLHFLIKQKEKGNLVAAYGAAAKGNTLLNYCGVKSDVIDFVVDASPYKRGLFLPGSHLPIVDVKQIKMKKPDFIIIFPWNIADEIMEQLTFVREWGAKFVTVIPDLKII